MLSSGLPSLGGSLLLAYRLIWSLLLVASLAAAVWFPLANMAPPAIVGLRLVRSAVLLTVATILFRRRGRDPVAAILSLSFLLWTISSSVDLSSDSILPAVVDRFRFFLFALAILLFPDGQWRPRWTRWVAISITGAFLLGTAEALRLVPGGYYLPVAVVCVFAALTALVVRFRATPAGVQKQQLRWVALGLALGIVLVLAARAWAGLSRGRMPPIAMIAQEGLFQLGIIVIAAGFLISLLRYRLYDAEAAISRSAAYAGLTLALVGTFAASEAIIQTIGQRYFGLGIGDLSGGIAAALAAILLNPLHRRISEWAEQRFQHDLATFKRELPQLLSALSADSSLKDLAETLLPRVDEGLQSTRTALILDGQLVATNGIDLVAARELLKEWQPPGCPGTIARDDQCPFPLHLALRCRAGLIRGWLLLGPRPDRSFYSKDDIEALEEIGPRLQGAVIQIAAREARERRAQVEKKAVSRALARLGYRITKIERHLTRASTATTLYSS